MTTYDHLVLEDGVLPEDFAEPLRAEVSEAPDSVLVRVSLLGKPAEIDPDSISASIETGALDNECLQSGRVDGVTLVEIDGTNRLTVQTRVEKPFRIL